MTVMVMFSLEQDACDCDWPNSFINLTSLRQVQNKVARYSATKRRGQEQLIVPYLGDLVWTQRCQTSQHRCYLLYPTPL